MPICKANIKHNGELDLNIKIKIALTFRQCTEVNMTREPLHLLTCLFIKIWSSYIFGSNSHPIYRVWCKTCNVTKFSHY